MLCNSYITCNGYIVECEITTNNYINVTWCLLGIDIYENRGYSRGISGKERHFVFRSRRTNHPGRAVLSPKKTERTHNIHFLADNTCERRWGEPYSKVFRELKQIPRTWWIRLLVRASKTRRLLSPPPIFPRPYHHPLPLPPYVRYWALPIVVGIVSAGGRVIASLPRKTETFSPNSAGAGSLGRGRERGGGLEPADDDVH